MSISIHKKLLSASKNKFHTLYDIIETNGPVVLKKQREEDLFDHLTRTVAGQQLSKQAATTIWNRIVAVSKGNSSNLLEFCSEKNSVHLKNCGLSKYKVKAILGVKDAFENGTLSASQLKNSDHHNVVKEITKLWGFGVWSADMISIFFFGLPDVWSTEDVSLRRGMSHISDQNKRKEKEILHSISPYKSYLSLHLWKAIDTKLI